MPAQVVTLDAYTIQPFFTLNSWVITGRHRHHRTRDHFGADSDLYIVIDEAIGPWGGGTPVKYVIQDLYDRINALGSTNRNIRVCYLNAFVLAPSTSSAPSVPGIGLGLKLVDGIVLKNAANFPIPPTFTIRALTITGGSVTLDAYVRAYATFRLWAYVV